MIVVLTNLISFLVLPEYSYSTAAGGWVIFYKLKYCSSTAVAFKYTMHCLLGFLTINWVLFIFFTPIFKNSNTDIGNIVCCLLCLTVSPLFKLQWVRPVNRCKCIWTAAKCIWTACKHFRILKFRECMGFFL